MCITSARAELSGTVLYAAEANVNGKYVHILGYQNNAKDLSGGPNAMILPFPTEKPMGPENVIDTRAMPSFLKEYAEAIRPRTRGFSKGIDSLSLNRSVQVFESGSYTVVLADNPADIPEALERVPVAKRPPLNVDLYAAFATLYPGEPIAVCCWNGAIKPEPLLWWYEPKDPSTFRLPGLDAHDGLAPRHGMVRVNHSLVFGSLIEPRGIRAFDDSEIPETLRPYVTPLVNGVESNGFHPNGDFVLPVRKIAEQRFGGFQRVFPNPVAA